jgi:hypothetical protein
VTTIKTSGRQTSSIAIGNPTRLQLLVQQFHQLRSSFCLPLLRDVLDPLGTSDQVIDSGKGTVWHGARLSDCPAAKQAGMPHQIVWILLRRSQYRSNPRRNKNVHRYLDTDVWPDSHGGGSLFFRCCNFLILPKCARNPLFLIRSCCRVSISIGSGKP